MINSSLDKILTKEQCEEVVRICRTSERGSEAVKRLKAYYYGIKGDLAKQNIDPDYLAYMTAYAWIKTGEDIANAQNN